MADKKLLAIRKMYEREIKKVLSDRTRDIYGGLCLSLHDIGVSKDGIIKCMTDTEKYWNDSVENNWSIVDAVREVVGIDIIDVVEGTSTVCVDDPEEDDLK